MVCFKGKLKNLLEEAISEPNIPVKVAPIISKTYTPETNVKLRCVKKKDKKFYMSYGQPDVL